MEPQNEQSQNVEEIQANPEEQKLYEDFVRLAIGDAAKDRNKFKALMDAIKASAKNLEDGLARLALSLYDNAEKQLGPVQDDDLTEAIAEAIIEQLIDYAVKLGIVDQHRINTDVANSIYIRMAKLWMEQNPDRADPEDLQYLEQAKGARQNG